MTREEKINHLKDILSEINENDNAVCYLTSEDNELIESAIKALEQQPCEDAISRADAINKVTNFYTNCERLKMFRHTSNEVKQTVTDILCDLPPVQPKPKMGHWIPVSERLPKPRIDVWCNSDMGQMVGYYEEHVKTWYGRDYLELMVTAWMPLPEPYKPQESE